MSMQEARVGSSAAGPRLGEAQRQRLAALADVLIAGGGGLPSASAAGVQGQWVDRVLAARPDLVEVVAAVLAQPGEPEQVVGRLRGQEPAAFDDFSYVVAGAYFMVPEVRGGLGLPAGGPARRPAAPDEADADLDGGRLLEPVIQRGPIFLPTPDA